MTNRIDIKQLDFFQDNIGAWYYTLNNIPYTGCAYQIYPTNIMAAESNFLNGYKEGIQKVWYQNGQLKTEHGMKNNIYHGLAKSWYENGVLRFEAEYDMGKEIWSKSYNEQGELIKHYPSDTKQSPG
jgi:antitoxin component YwqK of YwqJK toxin-antitoxin module